MSNTATRRRAAKAAARLAASVVFPAPPFCCATVITTAIAACYRIAAASRQVPEPAPMFDPPELLTPAEASAADRAAAALGGRWRG